MYNEALYIAVSGSAHQNHPKDGGTKRTVGQTRVEVAIILFYVAMHLMLPRAQHQA